jgi:ABC-type glycerol-3-phosphate transport system permease component
MNQSSAVALNDRTRKTLGRVLVYLLLCLLGIAFATPMVWMVSTSLKNDAQLAVWPPVWIPVPAHWENYVTAWGAGDFGVYLNNTVVYAVLGTVGQVVSASMAAFGFARLRFPGREKLFGVVVATMMLPGVVTMIPTYVLFRYFAWLDSYKPLIVPAFFGGGAFYIFMLRQFFKTLPKELFDSAKIDGASNYRTFAQLVLPLAKPVLATVAIYGFMFRWNDFMGPLIYINSPEKMPMTIGIRRFISRGGYQPSQFQAMMAMSFLMTLPIVVLFFAFQGYFVQGITLTGIKA